MTTTPTIIIGATGAYSTFDLWKASLASTNLITSDVKPTLQFQDQKHLPVTISGLTADATRFLTVTTAPGASRWDKADYSINPYRYDASKGAAIESSSAFTSCIVCTVPYTRIEKIQVANLNTSTDAISVVNMNSGSDNSSLDRVIIEGFPGTNAGQDMVLRLYGSITISNSLVVNRGSSATSVIAALFYGAKAYNTDFAALGVRLNNGLRVAGSTITLTNVSVMGATAADDGGVAITKTKCFSDSGSIGYTMLPFTTATFTNVTNGSHDFRTVSGSGLIDAGVVTTQGAISANGLPRGSYGAAPDASSWEFVPSGGTASVLSNPTATPTGSTSASGTVSTDTAGGLLYSMASANATETSTTVMAAGSQTVAATGLQNVLFSGLPAGATLYPHYVQVVNGLVSNVANGASFNTPAVDNQAPTFPGGAVITPGTRTSSLLGFSYPAASDNVGVVRYEITKDGTNWTDNGTGTTGQFPSLAPSTTYPIGVRAVDGAGNISSVLSLSMTTLSGTGSFKSSPLPNNAGGLLAPGTMVYCEWRQARIGTAGAITYKNVAADSDSTVTVPGLPLGAGAATYAVLGANWGLDIVAYEPGTAA
jgi:hypothetical protein